MQTAFHGRKVKGPLSTAIKTGEGKDPTTNRTFYKSRLLRTDTFNT